MTRLMTRRRFLIGSTLTASALGLSGCDALVENPKVQSVLKIAEGLTMKTQRLLIGDDTLAREFSVADSRYSAPTARACRMVHSTKIYSADSFRPGSCRSEDWSNDRLPSRFPR